MHVVCGFLLVLFEQVHALDDAFLDTVGHGRLLVGLVHYSDVVENVLLQFGHLLHAVMNDHRQLIAVGWIIGAAVRDGRRQHVAVAVLVLQAFTVQGGTAGGAADQEATGAAVASSPGQVANALEAEHRIEDVERQHRLVVAGVRGAGGNERAHGAGFVNALFENLTFLVLAVKHHLVFIDGLVQLAD